MEKKTSHFALRMLSEKSRSMHVVCRMFMSDVHVGCHVGLHVFEEMLLLLVVAVANLLYMIVSARTVLKLQTLRASRHGQGHGAFC